jgi:type IV pilus assembly protein PilP
MSQSRTPPFLAVAGLAGALLLLGGCSGDLDELRTEIEKAKQRPGGRIQPLPEVRPYVSHEYQMAERRSPFLQSFAGENPEGPRPDVQRPREYLEQFPLDTLRMVGTLRLGNSQYGLLQTRDGLIHRVLPGNHVGQNDGLVMSVADARISVVEIVPDGLGGYLERPAAIALGD